MKLVRYETIHGGDSFALQLSAEMFAVPVAQAPLYKKVPVWICEKWEDNLDAPSQKEVALPSYSIGSHDGIRFLYIPDFLGAFRDFFAPTDFTGCVDAFQILMLNGIAGGRLGIAGIDGLMRLNYSGEEAMFSKDEHWATAFKGCNVIGWVDPAKNAVVTRMHAMNVMQRIM